MDFVVVSERLAAVGRTVEGILRADPMVPDDIVEPHLYVGEWTINYDRTFGGLVDAEVIVRLLCSRADDKAGQERLKQFMRPTGPASVKAVIEAEATLGGACQDLHVRQVRGHRLYQVGESRYYGAEWPVRILGEE